jgi:hypothetical protein
VVAPQVQAWGRFAQGGRSVGCFHGFILDRHEEESFLGCHRRKPHGESMHTSCARCVHRVHLLTLSLDYHGFRRPGRPRWTSRMSI